MKKKSEKLPVEAILIDLFILREIVQEAEDGDDAQGSKDETDDAVEPADPHVLG